jgi:hypothetical protein
VSLTKCWMTLPQAALLCPHLGVHHHARELPVGVVHGRSRRPPRKPRPPPPDRRRSRARHPGGRRRSCERAHLPRAEARGPAGRALRLRARSPGGGRARTGRSRRTPTETGRPPRRLRPPARLLRRGSASSGRPVITRATACSTNSRGLRRPTGARAQIGFLRGFMGVTRGLDAPT